MKSHQIDYKIIGDDIQLVEIELEGDGIQARRTNRY